MTVYLIEKVLITIRVHMLKINTDLKLHELDNTFENMYNRSC